MDYIKIEIDNRRIKLQDIYLLLIAIWWDKYGGKISLIISSSLFSLECI